MADEQVVKEAGFLTKMFLEKSGAGLSSSRVISSIVVLNSLVLVDYLTFIHKVLPELSTLTEFVSAIVGVLYGVNKISNVLINNQNGKING